MSEETSLYKAGRPWMIAGLVVLGLLLALAIAQRWLGILPGAYTAL
jgi:hypothetical protein